MIANGADMVEDYEKKLPMARFVETEHALVVKTTRKCEPSATKFSKVIFCTIICM